MKKILSLLVLLVMTLTASAYEFTDSRVVTFGLKGDTNANDAKLTVTNNGDGTYNVEFQDIIVHDDGYTDNYGTFVFENVPGTSDGALTTISGSGNQGKVKPRDYPTITFTYEWNLTVKFNDSKAYAKVATSLPVYGSTDFTVVFGTDEFGSATPDPTVESSKEFTDKAAMSYAGNDPTDMGTAKVTVDYMSDDSYNLSLEINGGTYKATGVEKGTDDKGRTTYAGTINIGGADYQFYAIVYTDEESTEKIYLTVTSAVVTFIVGSDPDAVAPLAFPIENYQADGTGFLVSTPIDWETQKFQAVIDASNCNVSKTEEIFGFGPEATVWEKNIHIYADKGTYKAFYQCSNGNNNTTVNIADKTNITVEVSKADGLTVDGVSIIAADMLEGLFDITEAKFGSGEGNQFSNAFYKSVKLVDLVPPFVPETKTYHDVAYSSFAGTNTNFDENTVEITTVEDGTYNVVYKNLTVSSNRIGDLTIPNVTATTDETTGVVTYATTATEGTWTNINQEIASMLGISEGSPATLKSFTATLSGEKLNMTVVTALTGVEATIVFGEQYVEPNPDPEGTIDVVEHGFYANDFAWQESKDINWDTQYLKAEIDLTTCKNENENILSVGNNISAWGATNYHFYYTANTKTLQFNFLNSSDNISRYDVADIEGTVTIEISKKKGLVINGTQYNNKYLSTEQYADPTTAFAELWAISNIKIGGCQGNTMSNATYNYIHILPVEAEPVDPNEVVKTKTYTSNLTVDHDANLSNEAVYENKDVRFDKYANGDVAVTFVAYPVSENETCDLTFRGTIQEVDMSDYGMGKMIFGNGLVCKVENEASSFNGKTLYLDINIKLKEDGSPLFSYVFANDVDEEGEGAESIYYCGRFNVDDITNGINGVETEMENGNVSIYTVGGAKLNTLQKGINIVRLANGKTIKVIK